LKYDPIYLVPTGDGGNERDNGIHTADAVLMGLFSSAEADPTTFLTIQTFSTELKPPIPCFLSLHIEMAK